MFNPESTYRIQFNKAFNFEAFENILPYLQQLGIKTIYASPIFKAVPGSMHGYDITDPLQINPEIGTLEQLHKISARLKELDISWIQDIVPNHMAFHQDNNWLMDVLMKGQPSVYSSYFDIDWHHPLFKGKLILPILSKSLDETLKNKELSIVSNGQKFYLEYLDVNVPLNEAAAVSLTNTDLATLNKDRDKIKNIIDQQYYVPTVWSDTDKHINYRRFFTINGLISLNIQNKNVFENYHSLIKTLCSERIFQGLRVDHIDGLADPTEYLYNLREAVDDNVYITIEKILEAGEQLPSYWPVTGTTGYDFLAMANNIFTNKPGIKELQNFYKSKIADTPSYLKVLERKKKLILYQYMNGDLDNLCRLFTNLNLAEADGISNQTLKKVVAGFLIECPVYKYYGNKLPLDQAEAQAIKKILDRVAAKDKSLATTVQQLRNTIIVKPLLRNKEYNDRAIKFYQRCMQFTSPLMAKGGEDTAMYIYNSFIGHNDVGDTPDSSGISIHDFHRTILDKQQLWHASINATATHDTKRGEDVRARLNCLTDVPGNWIQHVEEWQSINKDIKSNNIPDSNDEYFIYQSLIGCYPMPEADNDNFTERFKTYIQKALREAKIHTNWAEPNADYEKNINEFIDNILNEQSAFLKSFKPFLASIADAGIVNSFAQVILKFMVPGVPDIYQGCELWDLSMVDPDNRRAVDYKLRSKLLNEVVETNRFTDLWQDRYSGKMKLWLIHKLLTEKRLARDTFIYGRYIPLETKGVYKNKILAFARVHKDSYYIIALPLNILAIADEQKKDILDIDWKDTSIILPNNIPIEWEHIYSNEASKQTSSLAIKDLLADTPFAILKNTSVTNKRTAGILMPFFSLPSAFGIGDFGPRAKAFVDFLNRSGQKYWQLLPLSPTEKKSGHSPYSSFSGMGINALFISPEMLVKENLLSVEKLKTYKLPFSKTIEYGKVEKIKKAMCMEAYTNYCKGSFATLTYEFKDYCRKQAYWLNDFALFVELKRHFRGQPWHKWPNEYKKRNKAALEAFEGLHEDGINRVKWLQFISARQWDQLRYYANSKGIKLFGDLPFYVSYDSADVWANPEMFCLGQDGNMIGIAGVPPDYFSKIGQLWNMPTYNWEVLKGTNYAWWLNRIRKNLELFDTIRLDHFRAFESYWQVPAGENTAENGKWLKGPGSHFFNVVKDQFGELPFVAEDLGDYMEDVYRFREEIGLPGMKLLQFAWGENMPVSVDAPHNYPLNCVVYTGTHDNNTTKGWFKTETSPADRTRLYNYTGIKLNAGNASLVLGRIAYASVAQTAILPIQDVLGLDTQTRINTPGSSTNNWLWRLPQDSISAETEKHLYRRVQMYNRLQLF